jgi:hypothetical protein
VIAIVIELFTDFHSPSYRDRVNAVSSAPDSKVSFEHKFLFARCNHAYVMGFLQFALRPDPSFAQGRISSIYYDTPTLDLYHDKRASTYLKNKIRVRWYGDAVAMTGNLRCWLELKRKIGGTREKERFPIELPSAVLVSNDLTHPLLANVPQTLRTFGHSFDGAVLPMLTVQYERKRFIDLTTGMRVAVDTDICCPAVNRRFVPASPPRRLDMCVLEIKGSERELPDWFKPLRQHVRRDAFSKYASCFEHLLQPAGRRE